MIRIGKSKNIAFQMENVLWSGDSLHSIFLFVNSSNNAKQINILCMQHERDSFGVFKMSFQVFFHINGIPSEKLVERYFINVIRNQDCTLK